MTYLIIFFLTLSSCFAAWDNTKPADSQAWNDAAGSIRDNWDALEGGSVVTKVFNVKHPDYGALGDGSNDDKEELQAAIDAAEAVNGTVYLPEGTYKFTGGLTINSGIDFVGANREGVILKKTGNFNGITVNASTETVLMKNFTLDSATGQGDASDGIVITNVYRGIFRDFTVENQGDDGIEFIQGIGSSFENLILGGSGGGNSGDGIAVNGTHDSPQTNSCMFVNIDCRSNGAVGFNLIDGRHNILYNVFCQSNSTYGIRINDRSNYIYAYCESNTTKDYLLTSEANCQRNTLVLMQGDTTLLTDNSTGSNNIYTVDGGGASPGWRQMRLVSMIFENWDKTGRLTMSHTGTNTQYDWTVSGTAANQTIDISNDNATSYVCHVKTDGQLTSGVDGQNQGKLSLWDGTGGASPGHLQISSPAGTQYYLFYDDLGHLRTYSTDPTLNRHGYTHAMVARATYDVSGGDDGTVGAHNLNVTIPDNAVGVRSTIEVITGFDSAGSTETVAIGIATDDTAGILAAADLGATGFVATIQDDGTATNYTTKTTAERQIIATVANEEATSGKLIVWLEFIISE